jgi:sugar lactone lactonase YvrE
MQLLERSPRAAVFGALLLAAGCAQSVTPQVPASLAPPARSEASKAAAKLYVLDSNLYAGSPSITLFARNANGNVAPQRTIAGADTEMNTPGGIAVDRDGRIYVSDYAAGTYGAIFVYAANAQGDAPPIATITNGIASPSGVAVDRAGNVYECNFEQGSVNVYAAKTYELVRTFTGPESFSFGYCDAVAVDDSGKVYVLVGDYSGAPPVKRHNSSSSYQGLLAVFPAGASGSTKPLQVVEGSRTGLTDPLGVAVDASGRIYVTNAEKSAERVLVFAPGANGNARPQYRIAGAKTKLTAPNGIAVNEAGAIFVTNLSYTGAQSIVAYAPGARGNAAPVRRIKGDQTQLLAFTYVAVR